MTEPSAAPADRGRPPAGTVMKPRVRVRRIDAGAWSRGPRRGRSAR